LSVNRIGSDANAYEYVGHSQVIDMLGAIVSPTQNLRAHIYATLDKEKLNQTRVKLNFLNDQDTFEIKN
jgi:predicted amidohydrolase